MTPPWALGLGLEGLALEGEGELGLGLEGEGLEGEGELGLGLEGDGLAQAAQGRARAKAAMTRAAAIFFVGSCPNTRQGAIHVRLILT